jgi:hypothetical protein
VQYRRRASAANKVVELICALGTGCGCHTDIAMERRYYSSRRRARSLTIEELHIKLYNLFCLFREKDYFKGLAGITKSDIPDSIKHEAAVVLAFQPFPISKWPE